MCEEEIELRQEHIVGARCVIVFASGKIDRMARWWRIGKEEGERWLRLTREVEESKVRRKPLLQEPEGILQTWGLALTEVTEEGREMWDIERYVQGMHAMACLISSAHAARGVKWAPPTLRLSGRLPERINDNSGLKRQKTVQEAIALVRTGD